MTVISTLQQQTLTGAASVPGHALQVGEDRKMAAHADACRAVGVVFVPLVWRHWVGGAMKQSGPYAYQPPTRSAAPRHPPAESTRHVFQHLAISLWRGNATLAPPPTYPSCFCRLPGVTGPLACFYFYLFYFIIFYFYVFYYYYFFFNFYTYCICIYCIVLYSMLCTVFTVLFTFYNKIIITF